MTSFPEMVKTANRASIPLSPANNEGKPGSPDEANLLIGKRMRLLRRSRNLRLKDLATAAGCSESLLSRIENDLVMPSLTTLHRLCQALEINVSAVLGPLESPVCTVYGPGARPRYIHGHAEEGDGSAAESLIPFAENRRLEGLLIELPRGGVPCGPFQHEGEEVGYVLSGELELIIENTTFNVPAGHSFFFNSDRMHCYRAWGANACRVIWINSPPSF